MLAMAETYIHQVGSEEAGQRLDNFLLRTLKGVPKSRIYRAISSGEVRINKKRTEASYRLLAGDAVRVPPIRVAVRPIKQLTDNLAKMLEDRIIFNDKSLMIIDKPWGLAVHGGSGVQLGVIEALRLLFPNEKNLELVHRLDRDTSGCLMIAKKRSMLRFLHEALREGHVEKKYQTLLIGRWPKKKTTIDLPLSKNTLASGERVARVEQDGKEAQTIFMPLQFYGNYTLAQALPLTGRTHQIRVHAAAAGHPVAGDEKYGDKMANQQLRAQGLNRLFLHAESLKIPTPEGNTITCKAPLDKSLQQFLDNHGKSF
jgi:23S rRNA pseudouridine955/2504/2580 synthase